MHLALCISLTLDPIIAHVVLNLFTSSSRRKLKLMLKRWDRGTKLFKNHANLAVWEMLIKEKPQQIIHSANISGSCITNVPRMQTYFTGRTDFLAELHESLYRPSHGILSEPCSCLIHAMGGMGKTQAALAYSSQYKKFYDYRLWIRAETAEKLAESFASVAKLIGVTSSGPNPSSAVKEWMENTGVYCLIGIDLTTPLQLFFPFLSLTTSISPGTNYYWTRQILAHYIR